MSRTRRAIALKATATGLMLIALIVTTFTVLADDIYVYPAEGQSDEQLARDRYECHLWAVKESDFDPSRMENAAPMRTVRVPVQDNKAAGASGKGAIAGAVAGGIIGAHDSTVGKGAVIGSIIGSIAGTVAEEKGQADAQQEAREEARRQAAELDRTRAERALRISNYRRALTACLEGREYVVR